ncbi:hypothetical protein QTP88_005460 [Uroleucon formosanum]
MAIQVNKGKSVIQDGVGCTRRHYKIGGGNGVRFVSAISSMVEMGGLIDE